MRAIKLAALAALSCVAFAQTTLLSIDLPRPNVLAFAGTVGFGGWALNDSEAVSTVKVAIDDAVPIPVSYGGTRADVCAVYPNSPDCPNVGWNYALDTTHLTNGSHMITVRATTAAGISATQST